MDFDLFSLKEISFDETEKHLTSYHDKIEEIFLDIISDEYKENIR